MDIKNLLFNIFLAGLTSYIISNLFFYFAKKDKKNKFTLKEIKPKENTPKEEKIVGKTEKTEEEEHKESKEKIFDYFKNGVPYSEKEYEALNKFLDDLQLIGLKFLQHDGYIEVIKEYSSWDIYGYMDLYGFMRSVNVKLDRVKGCLKIDNIHGSNDYRFRVNCEKIKPLIDRFNKTMGYEEEVDDMEELEEIDYTDKEEKIKDILHTLGKIDPKKDKGYLELEEFLKSAYKLGYKVKLSKMFNAFNLEQVNSRGKYIGINVEYNPHENEMKLGGQYHMPCEIEKEMREVGQLVRNFNNKIIIKKTKPKEIIKEEYKIEDTQIKNILEQLSKMDPKNEKGYLDLEEFIRGAFEFGYKVSLGKIYKTINLEKTNKEGKDIIIIVWFDPDKKELKLRGQIHEPYEIEKEMREIRQLVQNFNNKVIINDTNLKEIVKEKPKSEDTQKKYPSHYYINGRNTIEIIKDIVNKNAKTVQEGIDLFNVLKYLIRYRNKNKVDDLQKARNYLDWLIKEVEEQELSTLND